MIHRLMRAIRGGEWWVFYAKGEGRLVWTKYPDWVEFLRQRPKWYAEVDHLLLGSWFGLGKKPVAREVVS